LCYILLASLAITYVAGDCTSHMNCSSCIQARNCRWCSKPGNFEFENQTYTRCSNRAKSSFYQWEPACGVENIVYFSNNYTFTEDAALTVRQRGAGGAAAAGSASGQWGSSSSSSSFQGETVQLKPQRISLKMRVDQQQSFTVKFRQAEDYPVDLYYLMDLSKSMEDDKKSLSALGADLAFEMKRLTSNFRLGFGSFVDKVVMPYVSTVPKRLIEPCPGCQPPYGFINALKLDSNDALFVEEVNKAPVSGNLDAPEGGFDAIMQAIKCTKEIGWREKARHLLLFSTDAGFHYAGDGKLGGIVKPNDGQCHMDVRGEKYTHSSILDYPSVSQINKVAKEENINIIFAVTQNQASVYQQLSQVIEGSSSGTLTGNSSNIVDLVKSEYSKITRKLIMKDNATAPVRIKYFSKCKGTEEKETNVCDDLLMGDTVDFRLEVVVDECPADRSLWKQSIQVSPVALQDDVIIDLSMFCDCECERPSSPGYRVNAPQCGGHGTYMCGICKCDEGFLGEACECSSSAPNLGGQIDDSKCILGNDTKVCSGFGTCNCGVCTCHERQNKAEVYSEPLCSCTNFMCPRNDGELCSGPDRGRCDCNECKCEPGWKGEDCSCEDKTDACRADGDTEDCSGHGTCECNRCLCDKNAQGVGSYYGKFCEDCKTCKGNKCTTYQDCVLCTVFDSGPLMEDNLCSTNCSHLNISEYTEVFERKELGEKSCNFFDHNDCRFVFVYGYDEDSQPVVRVQKTLECPPKLDILGIVLGVIGAIVAVGLALLLMWKILTTIHDRREYAQFEKERMMAKWDTGENPIYKQATSTFKNPLYGGK